MKPWDFFGTGGALPTSEEIARTSKHVGWHYMRLKGEGRTVRFLADGLELDPGGIGKGYAVDRAINIFSGQAGAGRPALCRKQHHIRTWRASRRSGLEGACPVAGRRFKDHFHRLPAPHFPLYCKPFGKILCRKRPSVWCHHGSAQPSPRGRHSASNGNSESATVSDALSNAPLLLDVEDRTSLLQQCRRKAALIVSETDSLPTYHAIRWQTDIHEAPDENPAHTQAEK